MRSWFQGLWVLILVSTPFSLDGYLGESSFPYYYAYVATGILLGSLACPVVMAFVTSAKRPLFNKAVATVGAALGLVLQLGILDFAGFDLSWISLSSFPPVLHRILLIAEGFCCAFYVVGSPVFATKNENEGSTPDDNMTSAFTRLAMFICGLLFIFGFSRLGQFAFVLCSVLSPFNVIPEFVKLSISFVFALPVAVVIAVLGSRSRLLRLEDSTCNHFLRIALMSLASGRIIWGLISHAYGRANIMLSVALPMTTLVVLSDVALLCCCIVILKRHIKPAESHGVEAKNGTLALLNNIKDFATSHGLTERETEAVTHCLQGLTSAESASQMGLKPSTVRCYLQRAYKKTGVSNAIEFANRIGEVPLTKASPEAVEAGDETKASDASDPSKQILRLVLFVLVAIFAFPRFGSDTISTWHFNHATIVGFGLGALLAAEYIFFIKTLKRNSLVRHKKKWHIGWLVSGVLTLIACLQFVTACVLYPELSSQVDYGTNIVLIGSSSCLVSLAISLLYCSTIRIRRNVIKRKTLTFVAGAGAALILLSQIGDIGWSMSAVISSGLFVVVCSVLRKEGSYSQDKKISNEFVELTGVQGALLFGAAFAAAFAFGERWHATQEPFMELIQLLFLISVTALLLWRRWEMIKSNPVSSALVSTLILLCCLLSSYDRGIQVLFMLLLLLSPAVSIDCLSNKKSLYCLFGCGTGLLVGRLLIDRWSELMRLPLENLTAQGNPSYISFATPLLTAFLLLIGFICVFVLEGLDAPQHKDVALTERYLLFLRSQGLNELEANVLCKTVQGMTATQIAMETCYSVGHIGAIRAQGYEKLGIHSRSELSDLLEELVTLR